MLKPGNGKEIYAASPKIINNSRKNGCKTNSFLKPFGNLLDIFQQFNALYEVHMALLGTQQGKQQTAKRL